MNRRMILGGALLWLICTAMAAGASAQQSGADKSEAEGRHAGIGAEKMYLHTDKTVYITGEILWFAAYNVDAWSKKPADLSKIAYIELISPEARPALQAKISLTKGLGEGSMLLPLSLTTGSYRLRAYTQWMRNRPAKSFFETELVVINPLKTLPADGGGYSPEIKPAFGPQTDPSSHIRAKLAISTSSDRDAYEARSEVSVSVSLSGDNATGTPAHVSLSVFRIDSLQPPPVNDINTSFSESFSPGNNNRVNAQAATAHFPPEFAGHLVQGRVTRKRDGSPAADVLVCVAAQGKPFRFAGANTGPDGIFRVDLPDFSGYQELLLETENQKDSDFRTEVFSPFDETIPASPARAWHLRPGQEEDLRFHSLAAQVQDAYRLEEMNQFTMKQDPDSTPFYGKADQEFLLDDYTRFNSMEEVMREYVSGLTVKKIRRNFHFRLLDLPRKEFFSGDPLILVDGVPVIQGDQVMAIDPLKIRKIDVVTRKWYLGGMESQGILSLSSYTGNLEGFEYDSSFLALDYEGLQQRRNFFAPRYRTSDQASPRMPDFRTVLFWKPDLTIQPGSPGLIHFYTSDRKGKYMVRVEGIDESGNAGTSYFTFDVR